MLAISLKAQELCHSPCLQWLPNFFKEIKLNLFSRLNSICRNVGDNIPYISDNSERLALNLRYPEFPERLTVYCEESRSAHWCLKNWPPVQFGLLNVTEDVWDGHTFCAAVFECRICIRLQEIKYKSAASQSSAVMDFHHWYKGCWSILVSYWLQAVQTTSICCLQMQYSF